MSQQSAAQAALNSNLGLFDDSDEVDELILSMLPPEELEQLQAEAATFVSSSLFMRQNLESGAQEILDKVNRDRDEALQGLKQTTGEQLGSVRKGMDHLTRSERSVRELSDMFQEMDSLVATMQSKASYDQIKAVHFYHENLSNVVNWTDCLECFDPTSSRPSASSSAPSSATAAAAASGQSSSSSSSSSSAANQNSMFHGGVGDEAAALLLGIDFTPPPSSSSSSSGLPPPPPQPSYSMSPSEELEAQIGKSPNGMMEVYSKLRVMSSIRARIAIPAVFKHHGVSISYVRRHLIEGERVLGVFIEKCYEIIRRAPEILTEYILTDKATAAANDRLLLFTVLKICNQEMRDPGLYADIDAAANHLNTLLLRMAENSSQSASRRNTQRRHQQEQQQQQNNSDTHELVTSVLNWEVISKHLSVGARAFFFDYICVDRFSEEHPERKNMQLRELVMDVNLTCEAIAAQMEPLSECIEQAMVGAPIGPLPSIVAHLMKELHNELATLIIGNYCSASSGVAITGLQRVLQLTVEYRESCLEKGTIGQFVAPAAMEAVSTQVLEVAVSGMRDYLGTYARNTVLQNVKTEVKQLHDGTFYTTGPRDLLVIINSMLKSVTKDASTEVRSKMSDACGTALRYYVDRFCDKVQYTYFLKWYEEDIVKKSGFHGVPVGDRWVLWTCTLINDFLELQRNVGKLDASLFDLHHQATSGVIAQQQQQVQLSAPPNSSSAPSASAAATAAAGGGGGTNLIPAALKQQEQQQQAAAASGSSSLSPLQTFASILGREVFLKLISHMCDYLELKAITKQWDAAFATTIVCPSQNSKLKSNTMQLLVDELRSYILSIQGSICAPWNTVTSRLITTRMMQIYLQRMLAAIKAGDIGDEKTKTLSCRQALAQRLVDDVKLWTILVSELGAVNEDQLRFEDRNPEILPDLYSSGLAALRLLHTLSLCDTVEKLKNALDVSILSNYNNNNNNNNNAFIVDSSSSPASALSDIPDYALEVMFDANKAHTSEVSSSTKSAMNKVCKEFVSDRAALLSAGSNNNNNNNNNSEAASSPSSSSSGSSSNNKIKQIPPSIFAGLEKDRIIPKSRGFFKGSSIDDASQLKVGYRAGFINICFEVVNTRDVATPTNMGKKAEEIQTVSIDAFFSGAEAAKAKELSIAAGNKHEEKEQEDKEKGDGEKKKEEE